MKKLIMLVLCMFCTPVFAEQIKTTELQKVTTIQTWKFNSATSDLSTMVVTTPEGKYRVFVMQNGAGSSVTAIKIEDKNNGK